jgi:hypothetical protein
MALHLIKLCVGCDTVEELLEWHASRGVKDWRVHTRQTPTRREEILDGGSLYRVFKGSVLCRQAVLDIETLGEGPARRCEIVLSPQIVRVSPAPRRPFQGWRYLKVSEAPVDLSTGDGGVTVPHELATRLRELGAW